MEFPRGQLFAFDAGSGLKVLGDSLVKRGERLTGKLFLSHPHWDHINTLPFFAPFYVQGNEWEILGSPHGSVTVKDLVNAQMDGVFFPVTTREFGAKLEFRDLREGTYEFDEISVSTMLLAHPGNCLGYRVSMDGRSVCYITDNELSSPTSDNHTVEYEERLLEFVRGTDALIIDTNYLDEEYESKVGWGHSSVTQVANFAHRAEVKTLYPFHHDYAHDDDTIDRKLEQMQEILKTSDTEVVQPVERDSFRL
jgi:phosphoribosyl 1,2-cyclic phosphodiesterase